MYKEFYYLTSEFLQAPHYGVLLMLSSAERVKVFFIGFSLKIPKTEFRFTPKCNSILSRPDRDPLRQRLPGQKPPGQRPLSSWTETSLSMDRDPLMDIDPPHGQRPPCEQNHRQKTTFWVPLLHVSCLIQCIPDKKVVLHLGEK